MTKKIVGVIIFIVLIANAVISYGALTANGVTSSNKIKVKPGEEVVITVALSNVDGGEQGITKLENVLKYDKTVFEQVKQSNITSSWTINYSEMQELVTAETTTPITAGATIFAVTLKVKADAKEGNTVIEFTNGKVYNAEESQGIAIQSVNLTVEKDQTIAPPGNNEPPKDADKDLPGTGIEDTMAIGVGIFGILGIASYIFLVKNRYI